MGRWGRLEVGESTFRSGNLSKYTAAHTPQKLTLVKPSLSTFGQCNRHYYVSFRTSNVTLVRSEDKQ